MQFIDTHLHLQDYKTGFATDIVKEALIGGVDRLVCAATGMFDWDKVARFAKQYPGTVVPAFGLHPWYLQEAKPDWLPRLREYLTRFPEALIGECGLDGIKNPDDEPQNSVFCQHILLAEELKRPLIIHAVRAQEWLENYWDMVPAKFVFHSYNGKREVLKKILKAGGYVSFSASILRNADKEELVNMVPADKLLLETDGPYQGPDKNAEVTPAYIPRLAEKIAGWRGENLPDFAARVYQNSLEFIHVG